MKNILITGATGLLGSNLTSYLLDQKEYFKNIICLARSHVVSPYKDKVKMVFGDINDFKFVDSVVNHYKIDSIYHLAAESIIVSANKGPLHTLHTNILGTANVLESAKNNQVKSVLVMTSDKYYGQNPNVPYKETLKPEPTGVYEVSKACSDLICYMYGKNFDLPVISVRCANLFGPQDYNFTRLVPNSIIRMIENKSPMLWEDAKDYIREFIYVEDAVEVLEKLIHISPENRGDAVNLGSGVIYRVEDFIYEIIDSINELGNNFPRKIEIVTKDKYFREIPKQHLDLTKLKSLVGKLPQRTNNIRQCLKDTYKFYIEHLSKYN